MAVKKIKGTTQSGIEFQLDPAIKDDARLLYLLTLMQKKDIDWQQQSQALFDMLKLIFGTDEGLVQFMNAVAEKHKGVCTPQSMMAELNDMFEAINGKNS